MSTTYTASLKLQQPANGDTGWDVNLNANAATIDALNPVGDMAVTTHEVPSASLNIDIASGIYCKTDGTIGTYAGATSVALAASSTNYIYISSAFALVTNTTGFPASGAYWPLATAITTGTTITSIADYRMAFTACGFAGLSLGGGTLTDGANIAVGTTTGTTIGTATTQKIGFLAATPAAQQTGGSAAAGSSYTSTEQAMLQKAYNALRTFGFLS